LLERKERERLEREEPSAAAVLFLSGKGHWVKGSGGAGRRQRVDLDEAEKGKEGSCKPGTSFLVPWLMLAAAEERMGRKEERKEEGKGPITKRCGRRRDHFNSTLHSNHRKGLIYRTLGPD
jgi:hypothetical protein